MSAETYNVAGVVVNLELAKGKSRESVIKTLEKCLPTYLKLSGIDPKSFIIEVVERSLYLDQCGAITFTGRLDGKQLILIRSDVLRLMPSALYHEIVHAKQFQSPDFEILDLCVFKYKDTVYDSSDITEVKRGGRYWKLAHEVEAYKAQLSVQNPLLRLLNKINYWILGGVWY